MQQRLRCVSVHNIHIQSFRHYQVQGKESWHSCGSNLPYPTKINEEMQRQFKLLDDTSCAHTQLSQNVLYCVSGYIHCVFVQLLRDESHMRNYRTYPEPIDNKHALTSLLFTTTACKVRPESTIESIRISHGRLAHTHARMHRTRGFTRVGISAEMKPIKLR